ncbi:MAG: GNAT family N-acetyltransferase [Patescibacteria group bacterium]|jgi:GNAT superfamily N-acetyltransferase
MPAPSLTIRTAVDAESHALQEIWAACWADGSQRRGVPVDDTSRTFVAELEGQVVGYAESYPHPLEPSEGWLRALYVHPDHQREGIGAQLLEAASSDFTARGFQRLVLWGVEDAEQARAFYAKLGFVPDGKSQRELILGKVHTMVKLGRYIGG